MGQTSWVQIATAIVAGIALIVAVLAWLASQRSAAASERSAAAAESNAAVAGRAEQRQAEQRYDAAGPTFRPDEGTISGDVAQVVLRVVGGPGPIEVEVKIDESRPWCWGLLAPPIAGPVPAVVRRDLESDGVLTLTVALAHLPDGERRGELILPLALTARSSAQPDLVWTRRVTVPLHDPVESVW